MRKLLRNTTELGVINGVLYSLNRAVYKLTRTNIIHRYYFYAQPVLQKNIVPARIGKKYSIREVKWGDPITHSFNRPLDVIKSRYDQGAICFCAEKSNKLAGFIWLMKGIYVEDEVRCNFSPLPRDSNAWDFDIFICPEDRLGIAFAIIWQHANAWLTQENYQWTSSRVSAFNAASIRSHSRLGAIKVSTGTYITLGSIQFAFFSKPPYCHISLGQRNSPTFEIQAPSIGM